MDAKRCVSRENGAHYEVGMVSVNETHTFSEHHQSDAVSPFPALVLAPVA